jgi:UDP-N-acetylmuramyl pentapeptide phosphotransferase/UDP-N-acetylglucosamine-1-phosphate transferase
MFSWPALAAIALVSYIGTFPYRHVWTRTKGTALTAKGYGALLPFFITTFAFLSGASQEMSWACAAVSALTTIYWIDDIGDLKVGIRFALQFGAGALLAWWALRGGTGALALPMPVACIIAGAANIGLTNMVNFYDGADLHISVLVALLAAVMIAVPAANPDLIPVALATLAFVLPFAVVNRKPNSIYFGDAGSFAVASLITLITVVGARDGDGGAAFSAIPLMLPAMDVAYVFVLRLRRGEDMLSRNYHHLYQQLQIRYRGFYYLLPQPVFAGILLAAALGLAGAGFAPLWSVAAASLILTPALYFTSRVAFLK